MDPRGEIEELGHSIHIKAGEQSGDDGDDDLCCGTVI